MRVTLLGTGCPIVSTERYGPAQLVCHGETRILIDCGSGVTQRLLAAGVPGKDLDAVLLTHLHSDHVVDLFQLVITSWHQGRDRPQEVYGPPGTKRHIDGLMAFWRQELEQRIAHERRPSTAALELRVTEISAGPVARFGDMQVNAVEVDHKPVAHAVGFVCDADGRRVVISGDTRPCPALVSASRDADLLVHEVFIRHALPVKAGVRTHETVRNVASYHTLSDQVGKIAASARVKCLALTHMAPPGCDRQGLLDEVAADYDGPVVVGEDLMTIDVHRRQLTHGAVILALGACHLPPRDGAVESDGHRPDEARQTAGIQ